MTDYTATDFCCKFHTVVLYGAMDLRLEAHFRLSESGSVATFSLHSYQLPEPEYFNDLSHATDRLNAMREALG